MKYLFSKKEMKINTFFAAFEAAFEQVNVLFLCFASQKVGQPVGVGPGGQPEGPAQVVQGLLVVGTYSCNNFTTQAFPYAYPCSWNKVPLVRFETNPNLKSGNIWFIINQ